LLQQSIITALIKISGDEKPFILTPWEHASGGGGLSGLIQNSTLFEQAGVNFSSVTGILPTEMSLKLLSVKKPLPFYATGVSLVIHPHSPHIPTTHANVRYLEVKDSDSGVITSWFGGGIDLTPYLLYEEDGFHFHHILREACNSHDETYYPRFKTWCDEYFFLPHRQETRGIGGIFFDYLGKEEANNQRQIDERLNNYGLFTLDIGKSFLPAYLPIVERNRNIPVSEKEREFQLSRRGRYVEFNLLYDRGTLFGLKTGGRVESILMSLPPLVKFSPLPIVPPNEKGEALLQVIKAPRSWI
jgi:coproporphyrinogen III oxidase